MTRWVFPFLLLAIVGAVLPKEDPLPVPAVPPSLEDPGPSALDAELEADAFLLAQLATGEDPRAPAAVAWVALNRAGCQVAPLRCRVPLLRVVSAPRQFGTVKGGTWRPAWTPRRHAREDVHREVQRVLLGEVPDPTRGATHFHRLGTWTPPWAPAPGAWRVRGSHAFYRPVPARVTGVVKSPFKR